MAVCIIRHNSKACRVFQKRLIKLGTNALLRLSVNTGPFFEGHLCIRVFCPRHSQFKVIPRGTTTRGGKQTSTQLTLSPFTSGSAWMLAPVWITPGQGQMQWASS